MLTWHQENTEEQKKGRGFSIEALVVRRGQRSGHNSQDLSTWLCNE